MCSFGMLVPVRQVRKAGGATFDKAHDVFGVTFVLRGGMIL